ncbi:hypothetical protein PFISCL1PPCAC_25921, partial [Pristionchus fissidentatus]
KDPEVSRPFQSQRNVPELKSDISPFLCGLKATTVAYFHLVLMTAVCLGFAIIFLNPKYDDGVSHLIMQIGLFSSLVSLPFIAVAGCGVCLVERSYLVYPLMVLLALIIIVSIFLPFFLYFIFEKFSVGLSIFFILSILH